MSLSWKEIDTVLDELSLPDSHIQEVIQTDFRNLYLLAFKPGGRIPVRISLETGKTRIHRSTERLRKPKTRQRFNQFLHARITGARVVEARQINCDRVIRIDLVRGDETSLLWIRLWGGAANVIVTDSAGSILDSFFRRPKRGEVSGGHFFPGDDPEGVAASREKLDRFQNRFSGSSNPSLEVERHYSSLENDEELELLHQQAERFLSGQISGLEQRIANTTDRISAASDADRYQVQGDLVMANLYQISRGDTRLEAEDYTQGNSQILIPLDPTKTPQANAEHYYDLAKRSRRRLTGLQDELHSLTSQLRKAREDLDAYSAWDLPQLRELVARYAEIPAKGLESQLPGLEFESHGFPIYVGRSARENDTLLRRHVRGNDVWLHTRDYPGGYVFIRSQKGKSVPLEVLLDAGNLAVHFSKAKANGRAELYYTQVKYLRRAKDGPVGLVLPTQEKNLSVTIEVARMKRLMG